MWSPNWRGVVIGVVIASIGVMVSIGSYNSASNAVGGGSYYIFYGAVIAGALKAARNLVRIE
jgi:hypothetical protein